MFSFVGFVCVGTLTMLFAASVMHSPPCANRKGCSIGMGTHIDMTLQAIHSFFIHPICITRSLQAGFKQKRPGQREPQTALQGTIRRLPHHTRFLELVAAGLAGGRAALGAGLLLLGGGGSLLGGRLEGRLLCGRQLLLLVARGGRGGRRRGSGHLRAGAGRGAGAGLRGLAHDLADGDSHLLMDG